MSKTANIISWIAQVIAAGIMLQTLYFKFTAAPESVYIFTRLGMEPWGRIGIGFGELLASILLLIPSLRWMGGIMGMGLMSGALFFHITKLGIEVMDDGGQLFYMAVAVFISCSVVTFLNKEMLVIFIKKIIPS